MLHVCVRALMVTIASLSALTSHAEPGGLAASWSYTPPPNAEASEPAAIALAQRTLDLIRDTPVVASPNDIRDLLSASLACGIENQLSLGAPTLGLRVRLTLTCKDADQAKRIACAIKAPEQAKAETDATGTSRITVSRSGFVVRSAKLRVDDRTLTLEVTDPKGDRAPESDFGADMPAHVSAHKLDGHAASLYVNIDALRYAYEASFFDGRGSRIVDGLQIGNCRSVMLHTTLTPAEKVQMTDAALSPLANAKYSGPPLLRCEVTWSPRTLRPNIIKRVELTHGAWPSDAGIAPPGGPWVACVRVEPSGVGALGRDGGLLRWHGVSQVCIEALGPMTWGGEMSTWDAAYRLLRQRKVSDLQRSAAMLDRWLIVTGKPSGAVALVPTIEEYDANRSSRQLAAVLDGTIAPVKVGAIDQGWQVQSTGLIPAAAWRIAPLGPRAIGTLAFTLEPKADVRAWLDGALKAAKPPANP